jgi:hypothetical protein
MTGYAIGVSATSKRGVAIGAQAAGGAGGSFDSTILLKNLEINSGNFVKEQDGAHHGRITRPW